MIVAAPGMRGPFTTADLPAAGAYEPPAPGSTDTTARLLVRAATHYFGLDKGHPDRAFIERATQRLTQGSTIDELYAADLRAILNGTRRVLACD